MLQVVGPGNLHPDTRKELPGLQRDDGARFRGRQLDIRQACAIQHVTLRGDALLLRLVRQWRLRPGQQLRGACAYLEVEKRLRVVVCHALRVAVQAQDVVHPRHHRDAPAVAAQKLVAFRRAAILREEVERHALRVRFGGFAPVEAYFHRHAVRVVVAQLLVLARGERQHGGRQQGDGAYDVCQRFHRCPPFPLLWLPRPSSHTSEISAFVGPNQWRCLVACHT